MVDVRPNIGEIGNPQGAGFLYDAGVEIVEELAGLGVFDLGDDEVGASCRNLMDALISDPSFL